MNYSSAKDRESEGKFTRNDTLSSGLSIRHFIEQNKNLTAARYHLQFAIISRRLLSSYSAWA